jgi:hypothetical protein
MANGAGVIRKAALATIVLLNGLRLCGQGSARIAGTVTDPAGAVVPAAEVSLTEVATGATRKMQTSPEGSYVFLDLPPGTYTLSASASGFKSFSQTGITVQVGHVITVNVAMEIGSVAESLTITGEASLVNTQESTVQHTVDSARITELPLNGRNVLQLQSLLPGVVANGTSGQFGLTNPVFIINGARSLMVNYTLDGATNVTTFWNVANDYPNPDALQEFTAKTHSYSAVYGRNGGAVVEAATRSGTNQFHGTAFEFVRNDDFDARSFFAAARPPFKRNQYGVTFGGPVIKNKTFFFFSWQGTKERGAPTTLGYFPLTPAEQAGNFSSQKTIVDPLNGKTPFPGNIIPASRLNPVTLNFLNKFPMPLPNGPGGLYSYPAATSLDAEQYLARVDHQLTSKDRLLGRYYLNDVPRRANNGTPLSSDWFPRLPTKQFNYSAGWTRTFSPTIFNESQFSYSGAYVDLVPAFQADWGQFGANVVRSSGFMPELILNVSGRFAPDTGPSTRDRVPSTEFRDVVSIIRGRHSIQAGLQIYRNRVNELQDSLTEGYPSFTGIETGNAAADFMTGISASFVQYSTLAARLRQTLYSAFVQDDFKISNRLTLNLGLRYDPYTMYHSQNGQLSTFIPGRQSQRFPNTLPGLLYPGDPGISASIVHPDLKNFAPRIGFAWDPFGKTTTSIRGSYGIFYDPMSRGISLNRFTLIPPFQTQITVFDVNYQNPWTVAPYNGVNPFPHPPVGDDQALRMIPVLPGSGATAFNPNFATPYNQQWDLSIQHEVAKNFLVTVAYVGLKGTRLYESVNANPSIYIPGQSSTANTQQRRIYPLLGRIEQERTDAWSQYHALQLSFEKRYSNGISILSNYTFSKITGLNVGSENEGGNGPRDPFNASLDKGRLSYDVRHNWVTSFVWELPFGKYSNPLARQLLQGWNWTGILSLHSGFPFTVLSGRDNSLTSIGRDTADIIGNPSLPGGRSKAAQLASWFNTAAFTFNAIGTFGTAGLNILDGPAFVNFDMGILKNVPITETKRLQLRFESFNILNHANFANPDGNVSDATFGRISALASGAVPRTIEFGIKFQF